MSHSPNRTVRAALLLTTALAWGMSAQAVPQLRSQSSAHPVTNTRSQGNLPALAFSNAQSALKSRAWR